jgi:hypothetical protein
MAAPVEVVAGTDSETFSLTGCDASGDRAGLRAMLAPLALERLSILARAPSAPRPKQSIDTLAHMPGSELAAGIRRLDARLAERLALVAARFRKPGETPRIVLVSGYRPRSAGSYHSRGRALDFRIEGVESTALVAFCKTLPDTGCGYYPNGSFIHLDVRDPGTGNVAWTDLSRPGEPPRYVKSTGPDGAALPALPTDAAGKTDAERTPSNRDETTHSI